MCTELTDPMDGQINYSTDSVTPFEFGTVAAYSCNLGYELDGNPTRTCGGDGTSPNGTWSGSAPACLGQYHVLLHKFFFRSIKAECHDSSYSTLLLIIVSDALHMIVAT